MYDRRVKKHISTNAHLFIAKFDDGQTMEVQVNPEFDSKQAFKEAKKYLRVIGQLPFTLRSDVKTVSIHKGKKGFGGGSKGLLIHTEMGEEYLSQGILAEAFFHEASHTSLDASHARNKDWIAAQEKDPDFISRYAKDNPKREDIAESFLMYFALRYKPDRIDSKLKKTITNTIPNRIAYFDSVEYKLHPIKTAQADKGREKTQ